MAESSEDALIGVFSLVLGVPTDQLDEESGPHNTSQWDSLAAMELVSVIEETFDVQLKTREIMTMRTIGLARKVLRDKGAEGIG